MDFLDRMLLDAGGLLLLVVIPMPLLLALAIPYVVLRLRDAHSRKPDPQLGYRIGLHFFFSLSLLLVEFGLSIIAIDVFIGLDLGGRGNAARGELFLTPAQRNGLAMVVSGGLFLLVHFLSLLFLSAENAAVSVRRSFLGWRFAIHGVVVLLCFTGIIMLLLQKFDQPELFQVLVGTLLIWLPSWFIHFMLLRRLSAPAVPEEGPFFLDGGQPEDDEEERRHRGRPVAD